MVSPLFRRAPIYAGNITGEDVFNVLPFDNMVDMVTKQIADKQEPLSISSITDVQ